MFVQELAERLAHTGIQFKKKQVPCPCDRCKARDLNLSHHWPQSGECDGCLLGILPAALLCPEDKQQG